MHSYFFYLVAYLIIFFIIYNISKKLNFYDHPNYRKIHKIKIINTGGISIYIFYLFIMQNNELNFFIKSIILSGSLIVIIGFVDDRKNLSPILKLFAMSLPSIYLISEGLILENLGNYDFFGTINLGMYSIIITFVAVLLLINSINYIDGADGLLLGYILITLLYYLLIINDINLQNLLILMTIPVCVNLIFNILPAKNNFKIFNGDCGSLFFGFFISFFSIYINLKLSIHPIYIIWPLWLPVYDFLFVTIERIINKEKFYKPSKKHIHHLLLAYFNHNQLKTTLILCAANIIVIILGFYLSKYNKDVSAVIFCIFFILFFFSRKISLKIIK